MKSSLKIMWKTKITFFIKQNISFLFLNKNILFLKTYFFKIPKNLIAAAFFLPKQILKNIYGSAKALALTDWRGEFWMLPFLIIPYSPFKEVAKFKKAWNSAPVLQITQKISRKYWPCLYLSIDQIWWVNELWFKRYIQKCTLPHVLILIIDS